MNVSSLKECVRYQMRKYSLREPDSWRSGKAAKRSQKEEVIEILFCPAGCAFAVYQGSYHQRTMGTSVGLG